MLVHSSANLSSVNMYLFLSSEDSAHIYPTNTQTDFTVDLLQFFYLPPAEWECALVGVYFDGKLQNPLYILSNICCESYVRDTYLPLLGIVDRPGKIENPHYMELSLHRFNTIKVYAQNSSLEPPLIDSKTMRYVLHIRKK